MHWRSGLDLPLALTVVTFAQQSGLLQKETS